MTLVFGILSVAGLIHFQTEVWAFEDTAHYTSMARQLLQGKWLLTDLVYYSEQAQFGTIPAPQTVFPPGYSMVIAAAAWVFGTTADQAALGICYLSYAALPTLLFVVGRGVGLCRDAAFAIVVVWLMMATGWVYVWSYSSDIPFVALILLCLHCCRLGESRYSMLVAAGVTVALAFSFRYVTVFLVATLGAAALLRFRLRIKDHLKFAVPVFVPVSILMALIFTRNHQLVGTWRGGNNYDTAQAFSEVAKVFYYCVCRITGFSKSQLYDSDPAAIGQLVAALLLLTALLKTASWGRIVHWLEEADIQKLAVILFAPVYLSFLFYLDMTKNAGMSTRLLLPLVPFVGMTVALLVQNAAVAFVGYRRMLLLASVTLVASLAAGQRLTFAEFHAEAAAGRQIAEVLEQPVGDQSLLELLQERVTDGAPVLSAQPQLASLFLQRPLLGLPTDYFNTEHTPWSNLRTLKYADRFNIGFVLLLTGSRMNQDAEFFMELENAAVPILFGTASACGLKS